MHSPVTAAPVSAKHSATNVCQLASGIGVTGGGEEMEEMEEETEGENM